MRDAPDAGSSVTQIGVRLIMPLEIEEPLEDAVVNEGAVAVFECKVIGHPQTISVWYKDGEQVQPSKRIKIINDRKWRRLEIDAVTADDHGLYSIILKNKSSTTYSNARLLVGPQRGKIIHTCPCPRWTLTVPKQLKNVTAKLGERVELEVEFQSEALTDYIWFKSDRPVIENERILILNNKTYSILSILCGRLSDSGIYTVVTKTKYGYASSIANVQVIPDDIKILDSDNPFIEEPLPDDVEANEDEEIRLVCKVKHDINTVIKWYKNGAIINKDKRLIPEEYGGDYVGLRILDAQKSDSGEYTIVLENEITPQIDKSACFLTVNVSPMKNPPLVLLKKPLMSTVACYGSAASFDCSFELDDPRYYYVVWYVGHFRIERSNTRFIVICRDGEFLLHIKKLEPGMVGEVICELRRALPNQKSVLINNTAANLAVLLIALLPILEEHGFHYFDVFKRAECMTSSHIGLYEKESNDSASVRQSKVVVIEWTDPSHSHTWYSIDLRQQNGVYTEIGVSSSPMFQIKDPPVEKMMSFRIRTVEPVDVDSETSICIAPLPPDEVSDALKNRSLKEMEEFDSFFINTGDLIGCGAFGSVSLVQDRRGEYYAAKVLKTRTQKKRDTAQREYEMMKELKHPKLVELIDAFVAKDSFILVMDYLWGGELFDRIVEEEHIKEVDVVPYVRQICEALNYLHTHKIAHLDLKPENIICLSPNSRQVKIIDFGLARVLEEGHITRAIYGTRDYVAPEVLNFERLTLACDMWSLGVVTYMLLSGVMPFAGDSWPERSANITRANYNYDETAFMEISDLAKDFVDHLLILVAGKRMSAAAALNHRWIVEGPKGAKAGHMKRTRENLKSYLANYRARWQRAGNVMIAAHRLRTQASNRSSVERASPVT
ncbi:myosin light chain kinase, smooth muscle-like [Aphomia sociella]